jgi:hypothetical protein
MNNPIAPLKANQLNQKRRAVAASPDEEPAPASGRCSWLLLRLGSQSRH